MAFDFITDEETAYLITDRFMRRYFSGADVAEGIMLIGKKNVYFTDARYFYAAEKKLKDCGVETLLYRSFDDVSKEVKRLGVKRIGIDYEKTTLYEYENYKKLDTELFDGTLNLKRARSVKSRGELALMERAAEIAQKAYYAAIKKLKTGITEIEFKNVLESFMAEFGAEGPSFETIVAFGENSAVPHHETGNTALKEDTPVLVDMGAVFKGYCSDITRTCFYGTPSEKFLKVYEAVFTANERAEKLIKAGTKTNEADGFAREILKEYGFSEFFTHSLGHGVGLEIHEFPALSPKTSDALTGGTVFTVEPGVYLNGEFGVRIEDTVVIENGKVRRLFSDDKKLLLIKKQS